MTAPAGHIYEVRQRKDKRGVDLISDALPFGRLWWREPNAVSNAIDYAKFRSRRMTNLEPHCGIEPSCGAHGPSPGWRIRSGLWP
jgi:hypothetical protein